MITETIKKYKIFREINIPKDIRENCSSRKWCENVGNLCMIDDKCRGCLVLFNLWLKGELFKKEKVVFT